MEFISNRLNWLTLFLEGKIFSFIIHYKCWWRWWMEFVKKNDTNRPTWEIDQWKIILDLHSHTAQEKVNRLKVTFRPCPTKLISSYCQPPNLIIYAFQSNFFHDQYNVFANVNLLPQAHHWHTQAVNVNFFSDPVRAIAAVGNIQNSLQACRSWVSSNWHESSQSQISWHCARWL